MGVVFDVITGGATAERREAAAREVEALAEKIRSGECTEYSFVGTTGDEFVVRHFCSPFAGLALAAILQDSAMRRMKE